MIACISIMFFIHCVNVCHSLPYDHGCVVTDKNTQSPPNFNPRAQLMALQIRKMQAENLVD